MDIYGQLRSKLREAVERNRADGILLSGGLDTSILAFLANPTMAFTVALRSSQASDLIYARKVSRLLGIGHETKEFTVEEALVALPQVIRIVKSFDLSLPNDLSIYFALKLARDKGVSSVMSGDGSDELFAGYSYMAELPPEDLGNYMEKLSRGWHFSANKLGEALGVEVKQPFLDADFVDFALGISPELKVKGRIGKYVLRKSFEDLLPAEIVWRKKEPIEYGSGSTKLRQVIDGLITEEEFRSGAAEVDIKFTNKEHFFYWRIFNRVVGEIPKAGAGETPCPCCGAGMGRFHCPVCGFSLPLEEVLERG